MSGNKDIAESFLKLASADGVREAYEKFVHPDFRHHNAYFKGDRESLLAGMEENAQRFPDKVYETLRVLEEGRPGRYSRESDIRRLAVVGDPHLPLRWRQDYRGMGGIAGSA